MTITELMATKAENIKDAWQLIEDTTFQLSIYNAYQEMKKDVEAANATYRLEWEQQLQEWEANAPDATGEDGDYLRTAYQRHNPKPRLRATTTMEPDIFRWQEFAEWLYRGVDLTSYCFNASSFDVMDLSISSVMKEYQRRVKNSFQSIVPNAFPVEWQEHKDKLAKLEREEEQRELERRQAAIAAAMPAELPEAPKGSDPLVEIAQLSHQIAALAAVVPAYVADNSDAVMTNSDWVTVAKIMIMLYSANSAQVKTMEQIALILVRGQASGCPPMSNKAIKLIYNWLVGLDGTPMLSNTVFADWFIRGAGRPINNRIRERLGLRPISYNQYDHL